jgi:Anti-sigma-K factor rskA
MPPARLRTAILAAAAAERTNVVPLLRRRWVARGLSFAAAAAACVVVGLVVASSRSSHQSVFGATVVLRADGKATLQVSGLARAPRSRTYEAWIIPASMPARPAGLFRGGADATVRLRGTVPRNAVVAVTIEHAGGASAPTSPPILRART